MIKDPIDSVNELTKTVAAAADDLIESSEERQEQLTNRHEMDMINGTWLTKNIRPLTLMALLFYWIIVMPVLQAFGVPILAPQIQAVEMLSLTAFGFYFGSKGFEKIQVIKAKQSRREARRARKNN
jgi:hypothetical protein